MSKIVTTEGLSLLRDEFKNLENLDNFLDKYKGDTFDFTTVEIDENTDYPNIEKDVLNSFYSAYKSDPKDEFSLAKILYEALPLDANQASNNLYWLYLNLDSFFSYIKERWIQQSKEEDLEEKKEGVEKFILNIEPSQNSLLKSPIAGLWWAIHLTIDESLTDKYFYSKIFLSERNITRNVGSYQLIRDNKVLQAVLDFYNKYKDQKFEDKRIGSEAIAQQTIKALNQIGGLTVLSYLCKEEVYQKMEEFKNTIFLRAREVQLGKKESRIRLEKERSPQFELAIEVAKVAKINKKTENVKSGDNKLPVKEKILKYFNIQNNGEYSITHKAVSNFTFQIGIPKSYKKGYLYICYNESGFINRIKITELLKKKRESYQNGTYGSNTINRILVSDSEAIIGIIYQKNGVKYFKGHFSNQFKDSNGNVGLQGYKTMSSNYDNIEYFILPISLADKIDKLIFKSFYASGKEFTNKNYRKEFNIIKEYSDNFADRLF
jgi:hypothetical protein